MKTSFDRQIQSVADVKAYVDYLANNDMMIHPDDAGDYPELTDNIDKCFEVCGDKVYDIFYDKYVELGWISE